MPDTPQHPVTVGDLRLPCEHKRYDEHAVRDGRFFSQLKISRLSESGDREALATVTICKPRPATVADLVSALRAEGVLVVEKVDGEWPADLVEVAAKTLRNHFWTGHTDSGAWTEDIDEETKAHFRLLLRHSFDALAEAQPFPPAGG